jgi:hypothetical protein
MNIIIDLSNIMYNDLWMWNKTKLNWTQLGPIDIASLCHKL